MHDIWQALPVLKAPIWTTSRLLNNLVDIPGEGIYPQCRLCGMQTAPSALSYEQSVFCQEGQAQKVQHEAAINSKHALEQQFTAYHEVLEWVKVFKYLVHLLLLTFDDNNV